MKKTFVTTMPDHVGAFLRASRYFAGAGVNITRVSYNKAVDVRTLFLEAELTHADVDRCGLLDLFPEVRLSAGSRESPLGEHRGRGGLRGQNPLHTPYVRLCQTLASYRPPDPPGCGRFPARRRRRTRCWRAPAPSPSAR